MEKSEFINIPCTRSKAVCFALLMTLWSNQQRKLLKERSSSLLHLADQPVCGNVCLVSVWSKRIYIVNESFFCSYHIHLSPDRSMSVDSSLCYPRQGRVARQTRQSPWPTSQNVAQHSSKQHKNTNIFYISQSATKTAKVMFFHAINWPADQLLCSVERFC